MNIVKNAITLNPPLKGYQGYAFPLSILFSKNESYLPWLYNKLIIIIGKKDFSSFEQEQKDWMFMHDGVFKYYYCEFPKYIIENSSFIIDLNLPRAILRIKKSRKRFLGLC